MDSILTITPAWTRRFRLVGPLTIALTIAASVFPATLSEDDVETINGVQVSAYEQMLLSSDRNQKLRAMTALARYSKKPEKYIGVLQQAATDPDEQVRVGAIQSLGEIGRRSPSLFRLIEPSLTTTMLDTQWRVRAQTMISIEALGSAARPLLHDVTHCRFNDKSDIVREYALNSIVAMTAGSDDEHAALLSAITQREFRVHTEWVRRLPTVDLRAKETVAALRGVLDYQWPELGPEYQLQMQRTATFGLGLMGETAKLASNDLMDLIRHPLRYRVVYAAGTPGNPTTVRKVVGQEPISFWVRVTACWAMTKVDPSRMPTVFDQIKEELGSRDRDRRLCAVVIINRLAHMDEARNMVQLVHERTKDDDKSIAAIARLAYLRLNDPQTREQTPSIIGRVPLPSSDHRIGDATRQSLELKLKRTRVAVESDDAFDMYATILLPNHLEKALLQGDLKSQLERKSRRWIQSMVIDLEIEEIDLPAGRAIVNAPQFGRPLHYYWYDGDWYLVDQ